MPKKGRKRLTQPKGISFKGRVNPSTNAVRESKKRGNTMTGKYLINNLSFKIVYQILC